MYCRWCKDTRIPRNAPHREVEALGNFLLTSRIFQFHGENSFYTFVISKDEKMKEADDKILKTDDEPLKADDKPLKTDNKPLKIKEYENEHI